MSDSTSKPSDTNPYPAWAPRFWHGMLLTDWLRLLAKHRYQVHPLRWGLAITITLLTLYNTKMRLAQTALMGHRIANTKVPDDPIFILGHWRSGTTLLHELLSVDERFATPTTYQCFAANHFLLTEVFVTKALWFLIPSRRPMDNVVAGWHEPQEDEFALCSMGLPSPYLRIAFPNCGNEYLDYLDMQGLDKPQLRAWQDGLLEFMRRITLHHGKRLVLKSPTHTGRVGLLAQMFPRAKFIHIVRNPYAIVPSTLRLWKSLDDVQALQRPHHEDLEDYIFRAYQRMYDGMERHRSSIPDNRIIDVRYEDLVQDGCGTLARVYEQLDLGCFESVRPKLEESLQRNKNYKTNRHSLDDDLVARINADWSRYFERYGYPRRPTATTQRNWV